MDGTYFRIRVQAGLDPDWSGWLGGLRIAAETGQGRAVTVLEGVVPDQAALRGILSRLWDLNLVVLSVERLPGDPAGPADPI